MLEFNDEKEVDKTIYDLSEISKLVNDTIAKLEKDKLKKAQKAKYCNMAREKARRERDRKKKSNSRKTNTRTNVGALTDNMIINSENASFTEVK